MNKKNKPAPPAEKPQLPSASSAMPSWARELIACYESDANNQFILYGNVNDRIVLPLSGQAELGSLQDFLMRVLLPGFDIVLSFDLGNGIRVEKGGEIFNQWPYLKEVPSLPRQPRQAVEALTHYFRYAANLGRLQGKRLQIGCVVKAAHLVAPMFQGGLNFDLSAIALMMRDWTADTLLADLPLATFLITENLNDLHSLLVNNPRAAHVKVPLPAPQDLERACGVLAPNFAYALKEYAQNLAAPAQQLAGATISAVESLLKTKEHAKTALAAGDLVQLKKQLVEKDCNGLIEFIESGRTLDDLHGMDKVKRWLRQDIELWRKNDLQAMPMGYLICGPVGTGKTYTVECLAGDAGVPVVKLKNFRDRWVGSSEGNLEKIFRLLQALGRCVVFIDEADQTLGKRESGGDSGVSGRLYSMMAEEMSNTRNRGKIVWVLASSRPDLIEVDLKRPGRVDVKIPLFPTINAAAGWSLIRVLCKKRGIEIPEQKFKELENLIPKWVTPGAADALAMKVYRLVKTEAVKPLAALRDCLDGYQNPVPPEAMRFQIDLAVREASDLDFVPPELRADAPNATPSKT